MEFLMWPFRKRPPSRIELQRDRECADLVLRARAGDQVAMAMIVEISKNARAGNATALDSYRRIDRYSELNPPRKFE
jgi:hypothetical protein